MERSKEKLSHGNVCSLYSTEEYIQVGPFIPVLHPQFKQSAKVSLRGDICRDLEWALELPRTLSVDSLARMKKKERDQDIK